MRCEGLILDDNEGWGEGLISDNNEGWGVRVYYQMIMRGEV